METKREAIVDQVDQGEKEVETPRPAISMHAGVAVWCDCCSCAAEPYWLEVAEELGIEPVSDYEAKGAPRRTGRSSG